MYGKIIDRIIWFIERILILMLAAAIIIITLQVIFRYVLGDPLKWSEQLSRMMFVWMIFLGVPCVFHRKMSVCFDLLTTKLPRIPNTVVTFFVQLCVLAFAAFFFVCSVELCIETGARMTPGVQIPQNLMYIAMPIAMFLLILVMINEMLEKIRSLRKKEV